MSVNLGHRVALGATGIDLPRLGIGAGTLSNAAGPHALGAALEYAHQRGLNYIDTAPLYLDGESERLIGRFLREHERSESIVATKVGRFPPRVGESRRSFDYSADATAESLQASLERLDTDYIDVVVVHDIDREMHANFDAAFHSVVDECLPVLFEARSAGVIRAVGVSTRQPEVLMEMMNVVPIDLGMMAGSYTLLDQSPLKDLFPEAVRLGVSILIASPFNGGILATGDPTSLYQYDTPQQDVVVRLGGLVDSCARHGVSLPHAALQFPLAHPAVAALVVGNRSPEEVEQNFAGVTETIPSAFWDELRERALIPADAPVPVY